MRARICSAFSCDMFARVVWLRLWGAIKPPTFIFYRAARTRHAWFARLTRARRQWFGRRTARVLLADFWYFWSRKSTREEKLLYDTSLSEFFSLVRKERKGQKEERVPLLNSFCRLAATGANKVPRPSNYSIVTATGSKRSSADSDSLLCHVRLWQTSRFRFGCVSGCEHSEIGFVLIVPFTRRLNSRPPCTFSGVQTMRARICSAFSCDMFARVVWLRLWGAIKPPTFIFYRVARTRHAWLARLTRARRQWFGRRTARVLLADFWYFSSLKSTRKEKVSL